MFAFLSGFLWDTPKNLINMKQKIEYGWVLWIDPILQWFQVTNCLWLLLASSFVLPVTGLACVCAPPVFQIRTFSISYHHDKCPFLLSWLKPNDSAPSICELLQLEVVKPKQWNNDDPKMFILDILPISKSLKISKIHCDKHVRCKHNSMNANLNTYFRC